MVKENADAAERLTVPVLEKPPGPVIAYVAVAMVTPPPIVSCAPMVPVSSSAPVPASGAEQPAAEQAPSPTDDEINRTARDLFMSVPAPVQSRTRRTD